jgi:hypothetical protein
VRRPLTSPLCAAAFEPRQNATAPPRRRW